VDTCSPDLLGGKGPELGKRSLAGGGRAEAIGVPFVAARH
jgi:hypothetical protein